MNKIIIPVLASVLILGMLGMSQEVFSASIIIDTDTDGNQNVGVGDSLTITNGVTLNGNIIVNGGSLIIEDGASVNGNVEVNGGDLTIDNGNVNGNLIVDGANKVTINQSDVNGNVDITNSSDVTVTDSSVNGNLDVVDSEPVVVSGNTINGSTPQKTLIITAIFNGNPTPDAICQWFAFGVGFSDIGITDESGKVSLSVPLEIDFVHIFCGIPVPVPPGPGGNVCNVSVTELINEVDVILKGATSCF